MNNKEWKKKNKPAACKKPPWNNLIPKENKSEELRKIKQESIEEYGHTFEECPKRMVCFKKSCLGRPLPWKSKTAKPYLEELRKTQNIQYNPDTEEEELFIQTDCSACDIRKSCKNPCAQVADFINRDKKEQPVLVYKEKDEQLDLYKYRPQKKRDKVQNILSSDDIAWDCLSDKRKAIVNSYLYEQKDFNHIAKTYGLYNQSDAKYEFYKALEKLSEVSSIRNFIDNFEATLSENQKQVMRVVYIENRTKVEAADYLGVTRQHVSKTLHKVISDNKITWKKFVFREGNKVYYDVPEIMK